MIDGDPAAPEGMPVHPRMGFVALIGAPNAGKSTLLNSLVGSHVAIVTPKVQTTRSRMTGICMEGDAQIAFIDTPGIFAPKRRLDRAMVAAAWSGVTDTDAVVLVVDAARAASSPDRIDPETAEIIAGLKARNCHAALVLNKIDLIVRENLLTVAAAHDAALAFERVFMISARNGDGIADLRDWIVAEMPEGPWMYPPDQLSDVPMRLLAAEITREQAFLQLHQELPYSLAVVTERWEERDDGTARVDQVILVARDTHKGMVVGKGGVKVRAIGEAARHRLEGMLDRRIHLFLHVKVDKDWMEKPEHYRDIGLDFRS